jgi:hypothetical protein
MAPAACSMSSAVADLYFDRFGTGASGHSSLGTRRGSSCRQWKPGINWGWACMPVPSRCLGRSKRDTAGLCFGTFMIGEIRNIRFCRQLRVRRFNPLHVVAKSLHLNSVGSTNPVGSAAHGLGEGYKCLKTQRPACVHLRRRRCQSQS